MNKYLDIIKNSYSDYWNYIKQSVLFELNWENYFYGLIVISLVVWSLEFRSEERRVGKGCRCGWAVVECINNE